MEIEQRRLEELNSTPVLSIDDHGEIDWDQDAVVDEDELFADEDE